MILFGLSEFRNQQIDPSCSSSNPWQGGSAEGEGRVVNWVLQEIYDND